VAYTGVCPEKRRKSPKTGEYRASAIADWRHERCRCTLVHNKENAVRLLRQLAIAVTLVMLLPAPARADGFVTPFLGFNFGGDSADCPRLTECDEKRLNFGVSFGSMGTVFGFEEDISYAKNFFGATPDSENSVFSAMSNLVVGVGVGPVRPYVLGGIGLIRSRVSSLAGSITDIDSGGNALGYDLGGGITGMFGSNVGIRGDIRVFRTMKDVELLIFSGEKLEFWRASAGLAFVF
jgi:opacity protein-like surface antigen